MSESNVISETRFYNERLLRTIVPEMEAERTEHREAIKTFSSTDPAGSTLLSQCYDVFMGALIGLVRKQRGGLVPYAMTYVHSEAEMPSPRDPHLLSFAFRDTATGTNHPIVHIAVVYLDTPHPAVGIEVTDAMVDAADTSIDELANSYVEHIETLHAQSLAMSRLFYRPFMTLYNYLIGSSQQSDRMIDAPVQRTAPNTFFPFEVFFNDEEGEAKGLSIRLVQVVESGPALAVELAMRLDMLDSSIQHEKALSAQLPPTQSIH